MAARLREIKEWIKEAQKLSATHLMIICDTYDWVDHPVYVFDGVKTASSQHAHTDVEEAVKHYDGKNMQTIVEVYNMDMDIDAQLKEHRAYNV